MIVRRDAQSKPTQAQIIMASTTSLSSQQQPSMLPTNELHENLITDLIADVNGMLIRSSQEDEEGQHSSKEEEQRDNHNKKSAVDKEALVNAIINPKKEIDLDAISLFSGCRKLLETLAVPNKKHTSSTTSSTRSNKDDTGTVSNTDSNSTLDQDSSLSSS